MEANEMYEVPIAGSKEPLSERKKLVNFIIEQAWLKKNRDDLKTTLLGEARYKITTVDFLDEEVPSLDKGLAFRCRDGGWFVVEVDGKKL